MPSSSDEEDYMSMIIPDAPAQRESTLQRRQREKREAEARGRVKSKAELTAEANAAREAALSRSLITPDDAADDGFTGIWGSGRDGGGGGGGEGRGMLNSKSKGLAMMAKMGFKPGSALGAPRQPASSSSVVKSGSSEPSGGTGTSPSSKLANLGHRHVEEEEEAEKDTRLTEPLRFSIKPDKGGIGLDTERKRKINEATEHLAKKAKVDALDYRERMRAEREAVRLGGLFGAAQRVAERMDEERFIGAEDVHGANDHDGGDRKTIKARSTRGEKRASASTSSRSRPLKKINVLWRGLLRAREQAERDGRMRRELEHSLPTAGTRLKTGTAYEDEEYDNDDRLAMGTTEAVYVGADDLDDEDEELEAFEGLDVSEKLARIVAFMRREWWYCFWCKFEYESEEMDGCPGETEDDHD